MVRLNNDNNFGFSLRDYHHAAKTFTSEPGYVKLPYSGFLFHVNITFNNVVNRSRIDPRSIGVLVKSTDLPGVKFETETLNQYNRKRIVNKKVTYEPIKLVFHDDVANTIRNMWIAYNQHYSADSRYTEENTWALDDVYQNYGINRPYGLDGGTNTPFISKIEIYSMGNQEYSKMLLVNPVINTADFDNHDYSDGTKVMALNLNIEYENIIYSTGTTDQIPGFGANNPENYDQNYSDLFASTLSEFFGLFNRREPKPNTPTVSVRAQTASEISARTANSFSGNVNQNISSTPGNVNQSFESNITDSQYVSFKKEVVNKFGENTAFFAFPDADGVTLNDGILNASIPTSDSVVGGSLSVSSNGQNIATLNISDAVVSTTPVSLADTTASSAIVILPVAPPLLTEAERFLFAKSYPPLPSSDPRAKLQPYV
jgi:hypothetical protein